MKKTALALLILSSLQLFSQDEFSFSKQDSLRGNITAERIWWDLQHYELKISVDIKNKSIIGSNTISYKVLDNTNNRLQIDLQHPMQITAASQDNQNLFIERTGNVYYISLLKNQEIGAIEKLKINFKGVPNETAFAPWKAGFTWKKDKNGKDFVATSCQGQGASIWWPNKDHLYDEPDMGVDMFYTVPSDLMAIGNGRLISTKKDTILNNTTYHWKVINPINNYGIQLSIGDYVHFKDSYQGKSGQLDCDFYVLKDNLDKAKKQFNQVNNTLKAFEYWFGAYPFYEDGYKLVEVPYLGMEHQSAVGYGNNYENGYLGTDLSGTGWGQKFDFIIVHETGHEWFGNSITNKDIADMWIHESFTTYSEGLFLEYHFGKKAANEYLIGLRKNINNDIPLIGHYNLNNKGSDDIYFKGANMLQTIRNVVNNDKKWRLLLLTLNEQFYHKTVTSKEIEEFINSTTGIDFSSVFDQYLRTTNIPVFEYRIKEKCLEYRWTNCITQFNMPIQVFLNGSAKKLSPSNNWKKLISRTIIEEFHIDENFYVDSQNLSKY